MEYAERHGAVGEAAPARIDYWSWAKSGMVGGLIGGITFALFQMIIAAILVNNFWGPLRMIAGTVLGPQALTPEVSLWLAAVVGVLVHLIYSIVAGAIFALIIAAVRPLHTSAAIIVLAGGVFGLLMWLINFFVISPAVGWSWFPQNTDQFWQGFVAHTFLYGTILGWYMAGQKKSALEKFK